MNDTATQRSLAAILFTDIVGYTAQMQNNEQLALQWVGNHQSCIEKLAPAYRGEVYQFYGDGCLVTFPSAKEACLCAIAIQKEMQLANVPLKVGIHIGEIFWQGGKLYGDGVNIASRILSLGKGQTVLISRNVYDKIRNNQELSSQSLGLFSLKNVKDPVEVFALTHDVLHVPDKKMMTSQFKPGLGIFSGKTFMWSLSLVIALLLVLMGWYRFQEPSPFDGSKEKSLAIIPFVNVTQDQKSDHLVWGITEDIQTHLAKIENLRVIGRESSSRYQHSEKPLKHIASELGVSNILVGSVRAYLSKVRVSVKLLDPFNNDEIIWANDFDNELSDILTVQRDVALAISSELQLELKTSTRKRLETINTVNPDAYINYQKGQLLLNHGAGSAVSLDSAEYFFNRCIRIDPNFALAYIGLADTYLETLFWQRASQSDVIPKVRANLWKAMEIDPTLGEAYGILGTIELYELRYDEALVHLEKSIQLNPGYLLACSRLVWLYLLHDRTSEAFAMVNYILERDPLSTRHWGSLCYIYLLEGRFSEIIKVLEDHLNKFGPNDYILWLLGSAYSGMKNYEKAIEVFNQRTMGENNWMLGYSYARAGYISKAEQILNANLSKADSVFVPPFMLAVQYVGLNQFDRALDLLEESLQNITSDYNMVTYAWFINRDPTWEPLHDNARFQEMVKNALTQLGINKVKM